MTSSKVSSHLSNNTRQTDFELNSNASNNYLATVYSSQSSRASLFKSNTSKFHQGNRLDIGKSDALIMMSNNNSNSQQVNSLDIWSPEASFTTIIHPQQLSSSTQREEGVSLTEGHKNHQSHKSQSNNDDDDSDGDEERSNENKNHKHHESEENDGRHSRRHRHKGSSRKKGNRRAKHRKTTLSPSQDKLPSRIESIDGTSEVIAVENLVMTTLPNITDEDDLPTTESSDTSSNNNNDDDDHNYNRSLALNSTFPPLISITKYPFTSSSESSSELITVKDDTSTLPSSHRSDPSDGKESINLIYKATIDENVLNDRTIFNRTRAKASAVFLINTCSGSAVSTNGRRVTALHSVPPNVLQKIRQASMRSPRHVRGRGKGKLKGKNSNLKSNGYFGKKRIWMRNKLYSLGKTLGSGGQISSLDLITKRVSRSPQIPSQVSVRSAGQNFGMSLSLLIFLVAFNFTYANPNANQILLLLENPQTKIALLDCNL